MVVLNNSFVYIEGCCVSKSVIAKFDLACGTRIVKNIPRLCNASDCFLVYAIPRIISHDFFR